jgi:hypothetical protein
MKTGLFLAVSIFATCNFYTSSAQAITCDDAKPALSPKQLLVTLRSQGFPMIMLDEVSHLELKQLGNIKMSDTSAAPTRTTRASYPKRRTASASSCATRWLRSATALSTAPRKPTSGSSSTASSLSSDRTGSITSARSPTQPTIRTASAISPR